MTLVRLLHSSNASVSDVSNAVRIVHASQTAAPIERTHPDTSDAVRNRHAGHAAARKRPVPMVVIVQPIGRAGNGTAPPEPVYPVMVIGCRIGRVRELGLHCGGSANNSKEEQQLRGVGDSYNGGSDFMLLPFPTVAYCLKGGGAVAVAWSVSKRFSSASCGEFAPERFSRQRQISTY